MADRAALLERIAASAETLEERIDRLARDGSSPVQVAASEVVAKRSEAWKAALGGDEDAIARRLDRTLDPATLARLLADSDGMEGRFEGVPWLDLIGEVLERADAPAGSVAARHADMPFGAILAPFLDVAARRLDDEPGAQMGLALLSDAAHADLVSALASDLLDIVGQPMLAAFDAQRPPGPVLTARMFGSAAGASDDCYGRFVESFDGDGLAGFLSGYPMATRLIGTVVLNWVQQAAHFLERLADDAVTVWQLAHSGGSDGRSMVDRLECRLAEPHDGGRRVIGIVTTQGGRVIYKPRSLADEAIWGRLLSTLDCGLEMSYPAVIDREDYGWMAYVGHEGCDHPDAVARFFRRAGINLGLAYLLGAKDLHYENILACGEHPVLIDLETLGQPEPRLFGTPESLLMRAVIDREMAFLGGTVLRAEFLPRGQAANGGTSFVGSALATPEEGALFGPEWQAVNTDAMHLAHRPKEEALANLPTLDGRRVRPGDNVAELIGGFEAAWTALGAAGDTLFDDDGPLAGLGDQTYRFIFRPTRVYFGVRRKAYTADALRSGIDFGIALENLWRAVFDQDAPLSVYEIVRGEIAAMTAGDIPRFTGRIASDTLDGGVAHPIEGHFASTGIGAIRHRLADPGALPRNARIVGSVINALPRSEQADTYRIDAGGVLDRRAALDAAVDIGRRLAEAGWPLDGGGRFWTGLVYRMPNDGFQCDPLNNGLYEGNAGIGLFFAALHAVTGEAEFRGYALDAFAPFRRFAGTEFAARDPEFASAFTLGLGGGLGGIALAWAMAGDLLDDEGLVADAADLLGRVDRDVVAATEEADVLHGLAGGIVGAAAVHRVIGDGASREVALACAEELVRRAEAHGWQALAPEGLPAMAHGLSGIARALVLADGLAPNMGFHSPARGALMAEPVRCCDGQHADGQHGNPVSGWCRGRAGAMLARLDFDAENGDDTLRRQRDDVLNALGARDGEDGPQFALDQMCCGAFGAVDALLVAADRLDRPDLAADALRLAGVTLERAGRYSGFALLPGVGRGYSGPSLFQGEAGIGYVLLRLAEPANIPSVLALG